ncbi:hypothetical protein [Pseudalkalibacillus salsuginis]|uniref:hypothetical protein n=1 Tax=Pseudalkalibacillus salsuginis TaxID=2910972 RepID=UPI001F45CA71|nr:hypothetical protein [Pseudalkalibacillus salsuginis]MCF6408963.1 hypothetical protein [Pseudalkalibacillus salsuginis]
MNIWRNAIMTTIVIILFGWGMIALYEAQVQFAEIVRNPEPSWEITISAIPILVAIVIGGILTFVSYKVNKKKHQSWKKALVLPPELEEADEREKYITGKACRNSYLAMWFGTPIVTGLMLFYPFVSKALPYYPILIILVMPLIQIFTYAISVRRSY